MTIRLKYFHDSLNIVVIVAPGCEFFSVKCGQVPLTFTEWNETKDIFPSELLSLISEINLSRNKFQKSFK